MMRTAVLVTLVAIVGAASLAQDIGGGVDNPPDLGGYARLDVDNPWTAAQSLAAGSTVGGQAVCLADGTDCPAPPVQSGSFVATFAGYDDPPTCELRWRVANGIAAVWTDETFGACSSDSTTTQLRVLNWPAPIRPTAARRVPLIVRNNSTMVPGCALVLPNGTVDFFVANIADTTGNCAQATSFRDTAQKGIDQLVMVYPL